MFGGITIQGFSPYVFFGALFMGMAVAAACLTLAVSRLAQRLGAVDQGGFRRINNRPIPLLGGLAFSLPVIACFLVTILATHYGVLHWQALYRTGPRFFQFVFSIAETRFDLLALTAGALFIIGIGLIDDIRGMKARIKLLGQLVVAIGICAAGYTLERISLPLMGTVNLGPFWGFVVSVCWIVGLINAFNLIDGMDGLAAGIALIASLAIFGVGMLTGDTLMALTSVSLAGGLSAFLFFNFPPAKIFMGDTGSMFLGYYLATITLMGSSRMDTALVVITPLLAMAFPLFETTVTILRRAVHGAPLFTGDARHTHHRLLQSYSQRTVIILLYIPAIIFASSAILSQFIPVNSIYSWLPLVIVIAGLLWIGWLAGYLKPAEYAQLVAERQRNRELSALSRYVSLALSSAQSSERRNELLRTCCEALNLHSMAARFEERNEIIGAWQKAGPAGESPFERLRIASHNGFQTIVSFQFRSAPREQERVETFRTIAQVFENIELRPTNSNSHTIEKTP